LFGAVPMKWDAGRRTHSPKSNRQASFHLLLRIRHGGDASLRNADRKSGGAFSVGGVDARKDGVVVRGSDWVCPSRNLRVVADRG
jgi:hypothetical protein